MAIQLAQVLGTDADQPLPFRFRKGKGGHAAEQDDALSLARGSRRVEGSPGGSDLVFRDAAGVHKNDLAVLDLFCQGVAVDEKKLHGLREKECARLTPLARIENEDGPAACGFCGERTVHGVGTTKAGSSPRLVNRSRWCVLACSVSRSHFGKSAAAGVPLFSPYPIKTE